MALQLATLSAGQGLLQERGWSGRKSLALAVIISLAFGWLTVALHLRPVTDPVGGLGYCLLSLGVLGFWFLVVYFPAQLSEARLRLLTAESQRREAELARLRANLHPHFLLNTLNAVAGLLGAEPRQARQLVGALGELLRDSLVEGDEMRSLHQEVEWLRRYAEIFEIRYRGVIRFEWEVSTNLSQLLLPRLLLQPLLENAIEHGALRRPGGGTVTVRCGALGNARRISVCDDGPGIASETSSGLGLRLVRERLQLAYPGAEMLIDSTPEGTCVSLELPMDSGAI